MRYTGPIRSDEGTPRRQRGWAPSANPLERTKRCHLAGEFEALIRGELGLEPLLRLGLEFVLGHVGATNAAIFLPSGEGFTVGGYINYTLDRAAADLLLDHLADAAAPHIAEADRPLHATEDAELEYWLPEAAGPLRGCHVLALPCRHEGEALASIMLFRGASEPFNATMIETLRTIAPLFAAQLVRVIGIHHRHKPEDDEFLIGDF